MKTLLKGGRLINPSTQTDAVMDILIEDDVIRAIEPNISVQDATTVIQLTPEHWVTPGLVDLHVHFRDPGQSAKETTGTGSKAAAAGGYTSVCVMPNTQPVIDNLQTLDYVNNVIQNDAVIHVYPSAAVTKGQSGEELTEMISLVKRGVVAFTDDGHCVMNANIMQLALRYAAMVEVPIICHAEDTHLSAKGCMNEGYHATLLGLPGIPNTAESVIVARDIELARFTGGRVHFAHISTRESVDLIRRAKADGLQITAEVTPHHLVYTDAALSGYDTDFKMHPPLRAEVDRQALITGLLDGTIDAIASDHAPHTPDEKTLTMDHAPNGTMGLETSLGVILTHFYQNELLRPIEIIQRMSTQPAQCFNLPAGELAVGMPADITVIDPNLCWTVDPKRFESKSRNSCFKGNNLIGKAIATFVAGQNVYADPTFESLKQTQLMAV